MLKKEKFTTILGIFSVGVLVYTNAESRPLPAIEVNFHVLQKLNESYIAGQKNNIPDNFAPESMEFEPSSDVTEVAADDASDMPWLQGDKDIHIQSVQKSNTQKIKAVEVVAPVPNILSVDKNVGMASSAEPTDASSSLAKASQEEDVLSIDKGVSEEASNTENIVEVIDDDAYHLSDKPRERSLFDVIKGVFSSNNKDPNANFASRENIKVDDLPARIDDYTEENLALSASEEGEDSNIIHSGNINEALERQVVSIKPVLRPEWLQDVVENSMVMPLPVLKDTHVAVDLQSDNVDIAETSSSVVQSEQDTINEQSVAVSAVQVEEVSQSFEGNDESEIANNIVEQKVSVTEDEGREQKKPLQVVEGGQYSFWDRIFGTKSVDVQQQKAEIAVAQAQEEVEFTADTDISQDLKVVAAEKQEAAVVVEQNKVVQEQNIAVSKKNSGREIPVKKTAAIENIKPKDSGTLVKLGENVDVKAEAVRKTGEDRAKKVADASVSSSLSNELKEVQKKKVVKPSIENMLKEPVEDTIIAVSKNIAPQIPEFALSESGVILDIKQDLSEKGTQSVESKLPPVPELLEPHLEIASISSVQLKEVVSKELAQKKDVGNNAEEDKKVIHTKREVSIEKVQPVESGKNGEVIKLDDDVFFSISFKEDSFELTDSDKVRIDKKLKDILASDKQVKIMSHARGIKGEVNSSRRISLQRAIAVRSYMIKAGLEKSRINVQAIGNNTTDKNFIDSAKIYLVE